MESDFNAQIVGCHRYGPHKARANEPRPIVVKFLRYEDRVAVWSSRRKLKKTNITVNEDYPPEIEQRRKTLWPYLTAAFEGDPANPKAKVSAFIMLDKLILNNQTFTHDMIDVIPEYIRQRVENPPSSKQTDDVTVFFTKNSPLSNFHPADFDVDGQSYNCAEQYISYQKALLFENSDVAEQVLSLTDPKEMKQKVRRLQGYDEQKWHSEAPAILKTALTEKFSQNDHLKDVLLSIVGRPGATNV